MPTSLLHRQHAVEKGSSKRLGRELRGTRSCPLCHGLSARRVHLRDLAYALRKVLSSCGQEARGGLKDSFVTAVVGAWLHNVHLGPSCTALYHVLRGTDTERSACAHVHQASGNRTVEPGRSLQIARAPRRWA